MPEELLVIHCSPTLAGLKTASLFACTFADDREMRSCVRCWNRRLTGKGLRILPLCFENGRALIYVYRPARLSRDLRHGTACRLLRERGYPAGGTSERCIIRLMKRMREQAEDMDEIFYVYVIDDDRRLKGILPLKTLITNPSASKIKHVMEPDPYSVKADEPLDDVVITFEKYNLPVMPVVDSIGRLVGRITFDDVMDEAREQTERDYQLASGLSADIETSDKLLDQTKARLPWLLIGMIGGLSNSWILGNFQGNFLSNPAIALFIPLIGGTGGNVGIQSSAIVVQGLANGSLELRNSLSQIFRELGLALINASIISMLVFAYNVFCFRPDFSVTTAVSVSLFSVVLFAAVFGTLVPLTLEKLKIDPAIATGPFITITNDIIGMMIYMTVCMMLI